MKATIRLLFEKWTCKHSYKFDRFILYDFAPDKHVYICQKCGKVKVLR